jgi:hypothetical protein
MSHHYSGPNVGFPLGDARLDFTDLYAFPAPGDPDRSTFIMNFHPSAGVNPPGPTTPEPFATQALYELKIDTNGDAVADITYQLRFASSDGGGQTATLRRIDAATGEGGKVLVSGVPVSMGSQAPVTRVGDHRFFVGRRSDPFFFDVQGAINKFQVTGTDFFADKDICSVALEMPNSAFGSKEIGLWARTLVPAGGGTGGWIQADRGARPSQTPFLSGEQNDAYRAGEPANDARFVAMFAHALEHAGGYSPEKAKRTAETLLPDLIRYDPRRPASFPANGRKLEDDVADTFLAIITNGKATKDGVGCHTDLLPEFPYLGPPHESR